MSKKKPREMNEAERLQDKHIRWEAARKWANEFIFCNAELDTGAEPLHCILRKAHTGKHFSGGINSGVEWDNS